ncbi:MAG: DNA-binding protein, excisionase family [Oscillospiraceae bacterium]|nr:DNA-binding protein, excisionase family [Oscillospiraceae bacterium]
MTTDKPYYSAIEAAELLGISKNTVYDLIHKNELVSYRVGRKVRIDPKDIDAYINQSKTVSVKAAVGQPVASPQINYTPARIQGMLKSPPSRYEVAAKEFILCGQDALLDVLVQYLSAAPYQLKALRSYMGSYNALVELYRGNVSISSAHLWDSTTGEYNVPFIPYLLPGIPCLMVNLAHRIQGFYVAKGNPLNIQSWQDLTRDHIRFVNREAGCGVRVLIDASLQQMGIPKSGIDGYFNRLENTHISVASCIARGDADVGVGNEKSAQMVNNVDFIPIRKERLDLIIPKGTLPEGYVSAVMDVLNSQAFLSEVNGIGGYDITDTGKIIAEIQ